MRLKYLWVGEWPDLSNQTGSRGTAGCCLCDSVPGGEGKMGKELPGKINRVQICIHLYGLLRCLSG